MTDGSRLGIAVALLLAACGAAGCGDDGHDHEHEDPSMADGGGHAEVKTPCPESTPEFVATPSGGLEVTGMSGRVSAKLIDSDWPQPFKGDNEWQVLFRGADGEPLEDVEVAEAETFMTVHNHAGKKTPVGTKLEEPGVIQFEDVNLFMGGPWEVRFTVDSSAAGGRDKVVFHVCVND